MSSCFEASNFGALLVPQSQNEVLEQKVYRTALYDMVTRNRSVSGTFLCHFQSRALFVPDSQWNVYRITRYGVTERRIWYKKLSDTKGIRYRVTEAIISGSSNK